MLSWGLPNDRTTHDLQIADDSKTGSHIILELLKMGIMKMNDYISGPEGTFHKRPARSAGIESKLRPQGEWASRPPWSWEVKEMSEGADFSPSMADAGGTPALLEASFQDAVRSSAV